MTNPTYELQASTIERVLGAHKIQARVWQATVTPSFVRYDVTTALGVKVQAVESLAAEIAYSLGMKTVNVYREGGVVRVEVPRGDRRFWNYTDVLPRVTLKSGLALLGMEMDGKPLLLRLDSDDVGHILIAGATGSGKSALLSTLLVSLIQHSPAGKWQVVAFDQKGYKMQWMEGLAGVREVVTDDDRALAALDELCNEMHRRGPGRRDPHLVVAIDELGELVYRVPAATERIIRLTAGGREAGIHVIAGIQRPAARLIGNMAKANFTLRLCGAVTSVEDGVTALGLRAGAEKLLGKGDFVLACKGQQIRFQAVYTDPVLLQSIGDEIGRVRKPRATQPPQENEATEGPLPQVLTPAVVTELRRRYRRIGKLNRVLKSAGWKKGPGTWKLLKEALDGTPAQCE